MHVAGTYRKRPCTGHAVHKSVPRKVKKKLKEKYKRQEDAKLKNMKKESLEKAKNDLKRVPPPSLPLPSHTRRAGESNPCMIFSTTIKHKPPPPPPQLHLAPRGDQGAAAAGGGACARTVLKFAPMGRAYASYGGATPEAEHVENQLLIILEKLSPRLHKVKHMTRMPASAPPVANR